MQKQAKNIKEGDVEAFGVFFRNHYSRMVNYCQFFIKDNKAVDDLVQETFIHFWEKRDKINPEKSLEALIFVSLRNRCLNYLRDIKVEHQFQESYKEDANQLQYLTQLDFLGEEEMPLEDYLVKEMHKAIDTLPPGCRKVILLAKIEGYKNLEVANKLGISVKAVEKQIAYGKKKLSAYFQQKDSLLLVFFLMWFG